MKNIRFLIIALLLLSSIIVKAQNDTKGFTIQVYLGMYNEDGEVKSYSINDIYNVSLTDKFLIHNVMDLEGIGTDSQFYKISNLQVGLSEGSPNYKFEATSGISGNVFKYDITVIENAVSLIRTQPNGEVDSFVGISVILKTFQQ